MTTVVVITGASRGIGASAATWAGTFGAAVVLAGRDEAGLDDTADRVRRSGGTALRVPGDLTAPGYAARLDEIARDAFGRIDSLVNNAGVTGEVVHLARTDAVSWRRVYEVNVFAVVACTSAMLPALRQSHGRVVNVSSVVAGLAAESLAAYSSSKAALSQLTRTLAVEEPDITALTYQPGPTATGMMSHIIERAPHEMSAQAAAGYERLSQRGLTDLQVTSRRLALLALHAPRAWSGRVVDVADADLAWLEDAHLADTGGETG